MADPGLAQFAAALAGGQDLGPSSTSGDYQAMSAYWQMIDAVLGGVDTMRLETYLPKLENESRSDYDYRRKTAPLTNVYADVSQNLASKPFSRELALKSDAGPDFQKLAEDVDGQGNNLHNFAYDAFQRGIDKGLDWIFVDFTKVDRGDAPRPLTLAEEAALGVRPYWVHVPADKMLAVYSDRENGQEIFVHARIAEPAVQRNGFGEETLQRVRVLDRAKQADGTYAPATYEVYELQVESKTGKPTWISVEGPSPITIGIVPIVPFFTGKRLGTSWRIRPPLRDIAHMQVDAFQQESNLKSVLEAAAYPMLAGNGIADPGSNTRVMVGPRGVLFAPPNADGTHGAWAFLEPAGTSITALEKHLDETQTNMRDLGMQPLAQAGMTVVTTANVSLKAHSAVQAWALRLKDALEQAWKITALWLGKQDQAPEVDIFQDFGVDMEAGTELDSLLKAQAQGVLSKRTIQEEFRRRNVLSDNFDPDQEEERLAEDEQGMEPEEAIDPITGEPVDPSTRPLVVAKPTGLPPQMQAAGRTSPAAPAPSRAN